MAHSIDTYFTPIRDLLDNKKNLNEAEIKNLDDLLSAASTWIVAEQKIKEFFYEFFLKYYEDHPEEW